MKNPSFEKHLKAARKYACSLLTEGYISVLDWIDESDYKAVFVLRHGNHYRWIVINVGPTGWIVRKNDKIVKETH